MNKFIVCALVALASCVSAEPPSGYNYNKPSFGGGSGSFSGGASFSSGGSSFSSGGGGYQAVSHGFQTSEGQQVDQLLLEQIKQILLREESQASAGGHSGGGHSGGGAPSSSYGVPSSSYGVPSYSSRVVGIDLEGVRQALQVAQFVQSGGASGHSSGGGGGYPAARTPSGSYGAPF